VSNPIIAIRRLVEPPAVIVIDAVSVPVVEVPADWVAGAIVPVGEVRRIYDPLRRVPAISRAVVIRRPVPIVGIAIIKMPAIPRIMSGVIIMTATVIIPSVVMPIPAIMAPVIPVPATMIAVMPVPAIVVPVMIRSATVMAGRVTLRILDDIAAL